MRPSVRKLALAAHITLSVGWIGAVLAYLVIVLAAATRPDEETMRAAWMGMALIGWYVIVPMALASLLTGCVMALGTPWGLFRHYWVVISLGLTVVSTAVLLRHMQMVSVVARIAATHGGDVGGLRRGLRGELLHAGLGLLVLLVIEALNVYKPQGLTAYGLRRVSQARSFPHFTEDARSAPGHGSGTRAPRWVQVIGIHALGLIVLFMIMHLTGRGLRHH